MEEKIIESYMFNCNNNANIIIEATDKIVAIQIFEREFTTLFQGDWKVYRITTRVTNSGEYIRY